MYLPINEVSTAINKLSDVNMSGSAHLFSFVHLKPLIAVADQKPTITMIYYLIKHEWINDWGEQLLETVQYTVLSYLGVFTFRTCILICLLCIFASFKLSFVYIFLVVLCVFLSSDVYLLYYVCIAVFFFTLAARLLARSQYSEGPTTGHLDTGFSLVSLCL